MNESREIDKIIFGIYSKTEILDISVCAIDNTKKTGYGSVYDPRMGSTESSVICETCNKEAIECPGHMGHIQFYEPIVHPMYYKTVLNYLNCFCTKCFRLLITKDQIYMDGLNKYKGNSRFLQIQQKIKKTEMCCQLNDDGVVCGNPQPVYKFINSDSSYVMLYDDNKRKISINVSPSEIKKIFNNVPDVDIELIGFDPLLVHPRNFIIDVLPVCPPCVRPYVYADGKICDDDITLQYLEIIKANQLIGGENIKRELTEQDTAKALASLRFRLSTMFNNSQSKAKHSTNGRPIKGIKERFTGKDGQIRGNLLGKRCFAKDTSIIMWSGLNMHVQHITEGDLLVGDDGMPRMVSEVTSGTSKMYKINQDCGHSYTVNEEHVLTLCFSAHLLIYWLCEENKWIMSWYCSKERKFKAKVQDATGTSKQKAFMEISRFKDSLVETTSYVDISVKNYLLLPYFYQFHLKGC